MGVSVSEKIRKESLKTERNSFGRLGLVRRDIFHCLFSLETLSIASNISMNSIRCFAALIVLQILLSFGIASAGDWVVYPAGNGPGKGKHIVFLTGDEEYRSEEGLPMLAKILAVRHGFKCTVLFSISPADGTIDPNTQTNIPGMEALDSADLCVMGLRFRELPDAQMKHFVEYVKAGKPIIALRTSTHAFAYGRNKESPYASYDWQNKQWAGGFGQQVLGE